MALAARAIRPASYGVPSAAERLIVALDFPTVSEALQVVDDLGDAVSFYKIGLQLQFETKLRKLINRLILSRKQIFLDFKYIDIPATIEGVVRAAAALKFRFITVMGQAHIVEAAVRGRGNADLKILAVTLLTGMNEEDMRKAYNTNLTLDKFVMARAREAIKAGCDGLISSPNEIKLIKGGLKDRDFLIVTPGIRPRGSPQDDQKRIATPYDAILAGADYLVVGRPITRSRQRQNTARSIIGQMEDAFAARDELGYSGTLPIPAEVD